MSSEELPPPDPSSKTTETQKVPTNQPEQPQSIIQPSGQGNTAIHAPQLNNRTYDEVFNALLNSELSIEMETLSAGDYLAMVLMFFIQNRPLEGRFAMLRGLERYKNSTSLLNSAVIAECLCVDNLSGALHELHGFQVDSSFGPYIVELKNRLLARRLKHIQHAYSSIKISDFAKSLGYSPPSSAVEEILFKLKWRIANGFVEPNDNAEFQQSLKDAINIQFGQESDLNRDKVVVEKPLSAETLKLLVAYSDYLDRPL